MTKPLDPESKLFATRAEKIAVAERRALSLTPRCKLDLNALAKRHDVHLVKLSNMREISEEQRAHLRESKDFSAHLLMRDGHKIIVFNDAHTPERQRNSIAHEFAHLLLGHEPSAGFDVLGNRMFPAEDEREADFLGTCLLAPRAGLRAVLQAKGGRAAAAEFYGVSPEVLTWRLNMNGLKDHP